METALAAEVIAHHSPQALKRETSTAIPTADLKVCSTPRGVQHLLTLLVLFLESFPEYRFRKTKSK